MMYFTFVRWYLSSHEQILIDEIQERCDGIFDREHTGE